MEDSFSIYRTSWDEESRSNILAGSTLGALAFESIEKGTQQSMRRNSTVHFVHSWLSHRIV